MISYFHMTGQAPPEAPVISVSQDPANADVLLSWAAPPTLPAGYDLYRGTTTDIRGASRIARLGPSETSYRDSVNLITAQTPFLFDVVQYYWLVATNVTSDNPSNMVSVLVPEAPTFLIAEVSGTDNTLNWQEISTVATGQELQRALGPSGFSVLTTIATGTSSYTDTGAGNQAYFYRMRTSVTWGGTVFYSRYSNRTVNVKTFSIKLRTSQVGTEWKAAADTGSINFRVGGTQNVTVRWGDGNENTYTIPANNIITQLNEYDYGSEQDVTLEVEFEKPEEVVSYSMRLVHVNPAGAEDVDQNILSFLGLRTFSFTLLSGNRYNALPETFFDLPGLTSFSAREAFDPVYESVFPDVIFNKPLELLDFGGGRIGDNATANGFEATNIHRIGPELADTLESLRNVLEMPDFPANFNLLVNLRDIIMGMRGPGNTLPLVLREITSLRDRLSIRDYENNIDLSTLTQLRRFEIVDSLNARPLSLPFGWWDWDYSAPGFSLSMYNSYHDQAEADAIINSIYSDVNLHGQVQAGNGPCRNINFDFSDNAVPGGTYQQPAGYVAGSGNGTPQGPQERLWVLVNQYGWTITF